MAPTKNTDDLDLVLLDTASAGEVFVLQRAAFVDEALRYGTVELPPLTQTLDELVAELAAPDARALGLLDGHRLVGSVRVRRTDPDHCYIGRLVVAPDWRRLGLGSRLLDAAEALFPDARYLEMMTGAQSQHLLDMYARRGYQEVSREILTPARIEHVNLVKDRHEERQPRPRQ